MDQIVRPSCHHGWVELLQVEPDGLRMLSCEKCDATWPVNAGVEKTTFLDYRAFLRQHGVDPETTTATRVEEPGMPIAK